MPSVGSSALHVQLVKQEQRAEAEAIITRMLGGGILPATEPLTVAVKVSDPAVAKDVLGALSSANLAFTGFSLGTPSLDDVFFALTGRPAEEKATPEADKEARS